jgi:uncharacterized zinc-type alcohol dehydrogenase-like protein
MLETRGYAAHSPTTPLAPWSFSRRDVGPRDVCIEILYCGICHSDIHQARDEWGGATYPMVPGHEIVGRVSSVGREVTRFSPGQLAGVGCLVGSCGACGECEAHLENYCDHPVWTYNSTDASGAPTQGGYSTRIVVDEAFALRLPTALPLERVAPLLCAGITTYSPLRHWKVGPGSRVGVVGLGGLGHMAVQLAAAMGAEVTVFGTSQKKSADARRLGAADYVLLSDEGALASRASRLDVVLDTASAEHSLAPLLGTLRRDGALVLVGAPEHPTALGAFPLILKRRTLAGSLIGGLAETQEMLDFCADKGVGAEVEVVGAQQIEAAYERMLRGDVRYRFVIDAGTF